MLLLIGKHYNYNLDELFVIKQGVILPPKKARVNIGEFKYKVIYPSDIDNRIQRVNIESLDDYYTDKKIDEKKLLCEDDYIISCKGVIKGNSIYYSKNGINKITNQGYEGVITSNHCITFRPTTTTKIFYYYPYYLHNILDLLIPEMNIVSSKERAGGINYITIDEVSRFKVNLPISEKDKELDNFKQIFKNREDHYENYLKAEKLLSDFNEDLKKILFVSE